MVLVFADSEKLRMYCCPWSVKRSFFPHQAVVTGHFGKNERRGTIGSIVPGGGPSVAAFTAAHNHVHLVEAGAPFCRHALEVAAPRPGSKVEFDPRVGSLKRFPDLLEKWQVRSIQNELGFFCTRLLGLLPLRLPISQRQRFTMKRRHQNQCPKQLGFFFFPMGTWNTSRIRVNSSLLLSARH